MFFRAPDPVSLRLVSLGVPSSAATRLSRAGTLLDLPAGTRLCTKGERGTQAFLLLEGSAEVHTDHGIVTLGPGEVVGELAALDSSRHRNATVLTASPATVLVFDVGTFRSLAHLEDLTSLLVPHRSAA